MRTDARVRYTKMVIRKALIESIKRKENIDSVTVTEVCNIADINRATFYKHYKDCKAALAEYEDAEVQEFKNILENSENVFSRDLMEKVIDLCDKYADINKICVNGYTDGRLKDKMLEVAHDHCIDVWRENLPNGRETEIEILFSAVAATFLQLVITERDRFTKDDILSFMHKAVAAEIQQFM